MRIEWWRTSKRLIQKVFRLLGVRQGHCEKLQSLQWQKAGKDRFPNPVTFITKKHKTTTS